MYTGPPVLENASHVVILVMTVQSMYSEPHIVEVGIDAKRVIHLVSLAQWGDSNQGLPL